MYKIVVFASGNGSTLQAIIDAISKNELKAKIELVVSDNPKAYALERAKNNDIKTYVIKNKDFLEIDKEISKVLSEYEINLIVLAGYYYQYTPFFTSKVWRKRNAWNECT